MRRNAGTTPWFKGTFRVARPQGGRHDGMFTIELTDANSRTQFIEIAMDPGDFAIAITGQQRPATFQLQGVELVGSIAENKSEFVPNVENSFSATKENAEESLKPFEIDGWKARRADFGNNHRHGIRDGQHGYNVVFFRHIDALTKEPI